jgi:hypothetical protein
MVSGEFSYAEELEIFYRKTWGCKWRWNVTSDELLKYVVDEYGYVDGKICRG